MPRSDRRSPAPPIARAVLLSALLVLVGCDAAPSDGQTGETAAGATSTSTGTMGGDGGASTDGPAPSCAVDGGEPLPRTGPSATAAVLLDGEDGGPRVEAVVYPRPDYEGRPWSQWGQGLVLPDGRFLSAIGDHLGRDGNSYLYEYDPATRELTLLTDVLSLTDHEPGAWGYGKVHAQIVPGPCGEVYVGTYWGDSTGIEFGSTYEGDRLFRIDPEGNTVADLGAPVPEHGLPSLAGWPGGGLLYGEAPDPRTEPWVGPFFAYDVAAEETVFVDDDPRHLGFRNIAVDAEGRAYYSMGDGILRVYDPATGEAEDLSDRIPGSWMRASTRPAEDGTVFGVTMEPAVFFAIEPSSDPARSGEIREIGPGRGYTASIALDPDGGRILYVPGAHGDSWEQGTPLIAVDTETGEEEVLVELNAAAEAELGLRLGGTYDLAVDAAERIVYIGMNAGAAGSPEPYGEIVLLVVHLP
jgi:hypothetical protein